MKCPCEFCSGIRHPGCHGKCNAYIAWKADLDSKSADRRKQKELESQTYEVRQSRFEGFVTEKRRET